MSPRVLLFSWTAALALSCSNVSAQGISQQIELMGWSATGNEIITKVTISSTGIDTKGDPVDWKYSLVEVSNSRNGKVLSRYKTGQPKGKTQKGWALAKGLEEGKRRLDTLGTLPSFRGPVSPDGAHSVITYMSKFPEEMKTIEARCPGCNICTTTLDTHLVSKTESAVFELRPKQRTGNPYPPDQDADDCPVLTAKVHWHPHKARFVIIHGESLPSQGDEIQSMRIHDITSQSAMWEQTTIKPVSPGASDQGLLDRYKSMLADTTDPLDKAILLANLGDIKRRLGETGDADGYYVAAIEFDRGNTTAVLGRAMVALNRGDRKVALRHLARAVRMDRGIGRHDPGFGLFHVMAGNQAKAQRFFDRAAKADSGFSLERRIEIGHELIAANMQKGLEFMADALETTSAPLSDAVTAAALIVIEESTAVESFDLALNLLGKLDKKSDAARHYALLIAALRADSPQRLAEIIERSGNLLQESPDKCGLYYVRGVAMARSRRLYEAMTHHAAAINCDPNQPGAQFAAAEAFRAAGRLNLAIEAYRMYLEMSPPRGGDPKRSMKRESAAMLIDRLGRGGIIVVRTECAPSDGELKCTGRLRNNSSEVAGPISVELRAWSAAKRPQLLEMGRAELQGVQGGAVIDFSVALPLPKEVGKVSLTAGSNEEERRLNETAVRF